MQEGVLTSDSEERPLLTDSEVIQFKHIRIFKKTVKKSDAFTISACIGLFVVFCYTMSFAFSSPGFATSEEKEFDSEAHASVPQKDEAREPLSASLTMYELSDSTLAGMESGRIAMSIYQYKQENVNLMDTMGFACATPWLAMLSDSSGNAKTSYPNMLSLASDRDTLFLNVKITEMSVDKSLVIMPFKFKSEINTHLYSNQIKFTHYRGSHVTRTKDEAFCMQELYV